MARRWRVLEEAGRDRCASASVPVPLLGFHHARHDHRWYGEAAYGRGAAKQQPGYGCKLHLLISARGRMRDCAVAAAKAADSTLAEQLLSDKRGLTVRGAKGYVDAARHQLLATRNDLTVRTPRRRNQQRQLPAPLTRASNQARQRSETVTSQLLGHCHRPRNRATALCGRATRLQAKLAAHTLGRYLHYLAGRPLLALLDLALR